MLTFAARFLKIGEVNIFNLIVVVAALSTEAFSSIYLNGFLKEESAGWVSRARVVILVPPVCALMAAIGYFTGEVLSGILSDFATGLSLGILFIIGLKLIIKSFKPKFREMTWELTQPKVLLAFSFALGINVFLLGLALAGLESAFVPMVIAVAGTFFISSLLAILFGRKGKKLLFTSRLMLTGGVVISGSAIYYIIHGFNLI